MINSMQTIFKPLHWKVVFTKFREGKTLYNVTVKKKEEEKQLGEQQTQQTCSWNDHLLKVLLNQWNKPTHQEAEGL